MTNDLQNLLDELEASRKSRRRAWGEFAGDSVGVEGLLRDGSLRLGKEDHRSARAYR
jgi:hypothetical protein